MAWFECVECGARYDYPLSESLCDDCESQGAANVREDWTLYTHPPVCVGDVVSYEVRREASRGSFVDVWRIDVYLIVGHERSPMARCFVSSREAVVGVLASASAYVQESECVTITWSECV